MIHLREPCEVEKAAVNVALILLKLPQLYTHIIASDLRGNRMDSAILRTLALQYHVGSLFVLSTTLLNPLSWIPIREN